MYSLDKNEQIALSQAMKFVLSSFDTYEPPQVVVESIFANDYSSIVVSQLFEDLSSEDLYNIIWGLQETIYEAMCVGDFK